MAEAMTLAARAEKAANNAQAFGLMLRATQQAEWACKEMVCTFPHDGNCWCFNTVLERHTQQEVAAALRAKEVSDHG